MQVMTFKEFLDLWSNCIDLIAPYDYSTRDQRELGVIISLKWHPVHLSDSAARVVAEDFGYFKKS